MHGIKFALRLAAVATVSSFSLSAVAQSVSASAEVARRSSESQEALELLKIGDEAYQKGDFAAAVKDYSEAVAKLPEQANVVSELRAAAVQRFSQAAVEQARNLGRIGDYPEANRLLDEVDVLRPNDLRAEEMRGRLLDPIRTNPAATKAHAAKVDQVRRSLYEAEGFLNLGDFDRAEMTYEDILRLDPYNKAARRGMEKVNFHKSSYLGAAYDQARAKILMDVDRAWENRQYEDFGVPTVGGDGESEGRLQIAATLEKLRTIKAPYVDFEDATLEEAIDFIRSIARQNDTLELDEDLKGIDFVIELGSADNPVSQKIRDSRLDLQLKNVTLEQVLKVVTDMTATQYRIDEYAVAITPLGSVNNTLISRSFRVPPDFLTKDSINKQGVDDDPFADESERTGSLLARRLSAREKLAAMGVAFPDGASASFLASTSTLNVRNTVENLDYIARIISVLAEEEPVQVVLRTTVVDISQKGLEELGYDWVLGQFGGKDFTFSGGSQGNGGAITDFLPGSPVTTGLRSGTDVVRVDGLDSLLAREPRPSATGNVVSIGGSGADGINGGINNPPPAGEVGRSPGIVSLRGILGNGLAQMMLRGFDQQKGTDLMIRPEVITRSGQNAVIKSVREFWYPTEYEPPELPNSVGGSTFTSTSAAGSASVSPTSTIVTPSTPTSFTSTELGVVLEVLPQVSADRKYVDVAIKPQFRDFEGFVNYGSPITGQNQTGGFLPGFAAGVFTNTTVGEVTANEILMPLIRTVRSETNVTVADGHTIVIAGQMSQTSQLVEDKVPVLGDLPWIGRYFKTKALDTDKRSILIFLNVELQDPSGKLYRNR